MNTDQFIENIDNNVRSVGVTAGATASEVTADPANTDFFIENIDNNVKEITRTLNVEPSEVTADPVNTDFFIENIDKNVQLIKDNFDGGGGDVTVEPLTVSQNGTYQEEGKAYSPVNVNVNVQFLGIPREVDANGVYGMPAQNFTFSLPAGATNVAAYALDYAFHNCTSLTSVDLSSLVTVSGSYALNYAFNGCTSLTSVDLSSLVTVSGSYALSYAFSGCTSLTSVDLSSLTTVSSSNGLEYCFARCPLTTVNFSSLSEIKGRKALYYCFHNCPSLLSLSFPALTTSSFGNYTNQFEGMLTGCSNVTVHFPASIQSTIENWTTVTSGFSGTNTTVLFDL